VADLSQNPFALLSLIAAPAVLTNAASVLVMSTTNRFLRASERMRALAVRVEEKKITPGLQGLVRTQVDRTEKQAVLLDVVCGYNKARRTQAMIRQRQRGAKHDDAD